MDFELYSGWKTPFVHGARCREQFESHLVAAGNQAACQLDNV
jgi:hypothetical protein